MTTPKRPLEERIDEIDQKIATYENKIAQLKAKREDLLHPVSYQDIIKEAKKQKIPPKRLAEMLKMDVSSKSSDQGSQPEPEGVNQEG